jgi:hypothetical protein
MLIFAAPVDESNADSGYLVAETVRYGGMPNLMCKYDRYMGDQASNSQDPVPKRRSNS